MPCQYVPPSTIPVKEPVIFRLVIVTLSGRPIVMFGHEFITSTSLLVPVIPIVPVQPFIEETAVISPVRPFNDFTVFAVI